MNQIEKLKAEQSKIEQQIAQEQHKLQRLRNRKQYFEKGERTKRAHRLITRGAAIESIAPEVKTMDEQNFYELMEMVLNLPGIMEHIRAAAAYRAGEKLHSDYYGEDSDYTRKCGVVHTEILLPSHAPPEYADRQTLWNTVEKVERHPKAQLAYSFDIALQNEFSLDENIALARQFLLEQFVSRGMTVDFAVHVPDRENGGIENPHFHVMCPIRPLEKNGLWGAKQHRVYELDEEGNRIRDEDGNYVFNAVPTTNWGSPETLEHWRQAWAEMCNVKFEEKERPCRIDNRSYERQGLDILPTIHEGLAVRQMEAQGIRTNKGNLNRWIKATNDLLRSVKKKLADLLDWLKEVKEELDKPQSPALAQILGEYYSIRNASAYSNRAKANNIKRYSEDFAFLESKGLRTVDDLESYVSGMSGRLFGLNESMREKSKKMKALNDLIRQAEDYTRLKPIVDDIPPKGGWGKKHEKYMVAHDSEIRQFYAVKRKLDNADIPGKKLTPEKWQMELDALKAEYDAEKAAVSNINAALKPLRDIQYKVNTYLHDHQHDRQQQQKRDIERRFIQSFPIQSNLENRKEDFFMSEPKKAIDMTPEELEQWLDTLEIEDSIPGFYFANPDPYFKITPTTEPKSKNFWFGEDGHIHVKNISAYWIPELALTEEIDGTIYTVTGSYEGEESFLRKLERITAKKFTEKMEGHE